MPSSEPTAVVFGGPSPEHDVSILTGLQSARALSDAGHSVIGCYWSKAGTWHRVPADLEAAAFVDGVPRGAEALQLVAGPGRGFVAEGRLGRPRPLEIAAVVNCCHGGPGEDGTLQGVLDLCGLPYTGPTVAGAALGMDKLAFAAVAAGAGLPVLERRLLHPDVAPPSGSGPFIVKPRYGGSSIGIDVVADHATALARLRSNPHLRRGAVIEPYRDDLHDCNVAARSWPELSLSAIERPLPSRPDGEILDYADKYVGAQGMASAPRELPAVLPDALATELRQAATVVARLCELRGVARIDFLTDGTEQLVVNEINTIPGSLSRYLFVDPPLAFAELLSGLVDEARRRPAAQHHADGADGTVLRRASGIAAKLA